ATLSLFLVRMRRPAGSTLLPYTTLFRSRIEGPGTHPGNIPGTKSVLGRPGPGLARRYLWFRLHPGPGSQPAVQHAEDAGQVRPLDRKSTRLNSSHVKISYAVFCLKKKR